MRRVRSCALAVPLVWALLVFALLAPAGRPADRPAAPAADQAAATTSADRPAPENGGTTGDTDGSPGILGLPPKVHVLVNRTVNGPGAPSTPVAAAAAPAAAYPGAGARPDGARTELAPAGEPPGRSFRGRAPPHASV
jgi:hypothetical protein